MSPLRHGKQGEKRGNQCKSISRWPQERTCGAPFPEQFPWEGTVPIFVCSGDKGGMGDAVLTKDGAELRRCFQDRETSGSATPVWPCPPAAGSLCPEGQSFHAAPGTNDLRRETVSSTPPPSQGTACLTRNPALHTLPYFMPHERQEKHRGSLVLAGRLGNNVQPPSGPVLRRHRCGRTVPSAGHQACPAATFAPAFQRDSQLVATTRQISVVSTIWYLFLKLNELQMLNYREISHENPGSHGRPCITGRAEPRGGCLPWTRRCACCGHNALVHQVCPPSSQRASWSFPTEPRAGGVGEKWPPRITPGHGRRRRRKQVLRKHLCPSTLPT